MKTILFDIDYTLLDTEALKEGSLETIARNVTGDRNLVNELMEEHLNSLKSASDFRPSVFLDFFSKRLNHSPEKMREYFFNKENFKIYPEVENTLKLLHGKYNLGIFSEGFTDFQLAKIKLTGLYNYFEPELIFIFRKKLLPINLAKVPDGIIVDDKYSVVKELLNDSRFDALWLNRNAVVNSDGIKEIRSLKELLP